MISDRVLNIVVLVAACGWGLALVISSVTQRPMDPALHGVFTAVAVGALALRKSNGRRGGDDT